MHMRTHILQKPIVSMTEPKTEAMGWQLHFAITMQQPCYSMMAATAVSSWQLGLVCRDIMPGLIDKLGDNKVAVRQANGKLLAVLMDVLQPGTVLDALSPALMHGNWKVREAAVNVFIQVSTKAATQILTSCGH